MIRETTSLSFFLSSKKKKNYEIEKREETKRSQYVGSFSNYEEIYNSAWWRRDENSWKKQRKETQRTELFEKLLRPLQLGWDADIFFDSWQKHVARSWLPCINVPKHETKGMKIANVAANNLKKKKKKNSARHGTAIIVEKLIPVSQLNLLSASNRYRWST